MAGEPSYQFIRTRTDDAVGIVQLYRPEALNAQSTALIDE
jgi:enoyl-CoA hydratase/carnithine racemase